MFAQGPENYSFGLSNMLTAAYITPSGGVYHLTQGQQTRKRAMGYCFLCDVKVE